MYHVLMFKTQMELQTFLRTGFPGPAEVTLAKIVSIYFDSANGHHVLVYHD